MDGYEESQVAPSSIRQVDEHPSKSEWFPSSHNSPGMLIRPSPQILHTLPGKVSSTSQQSFL